MAPRPPPRAAVVALTGLAVAGALLAPSAPALVATDLTTGRVVLCRPMTGDDTVALVFTHSMYGGDVVEEYAVTRDARLRRVAMTTANAAAAEYYAHTAGVVRDGDRFRVDVPAAEFPDLIVRVDRVGAHRLRVGAETLDLVAATGDRHRLRLVAKPLGVARRLAGRGC